MGNNVVLYPFVCRCCCLFFSMAVVIRLQGLRVTAGSEDIRRFFTGLRIPDGGVHIIGGELEEAFIIFSSDEDARRAMTRSGGVIRGAPVRLLLSSKSEMQSVLERTTRKMEQDQRRIFEDEARCTQRSMKSEVDRRSNDRSGSILPNKHQRDLDTENFFVVFLNGLPFSVTEREIHEFFAGLLIDELVLLKNHRGENNGKGFVKFATREDAMEGLKRDREYIGSRYINVCTTTVNEWFRATGKMPMFSTGNDFERERSPFRSPRNAQLHARSRSRSPLTHSHIAPSDEKYCVKLDNLSYAVEKEDIKGLFHNASLKNDDILLLTDSDGKKTRSAFVLFKSMQDYNDALNQDKRVFLKRSLYIQPVSRENMIAFLESQSFSVRLPGNRESAQRPPSYPRDFYDFEKVCVFVKNLPFDVRKVEVIDFFQGFSVTEDKVWVLRDHEGSGMGQALVLFGSEAEAMEALTLNGQRFLGSEVVVKCISRSQMKQFTADPPVVKEPLPKEEPYLGRRSRSREGSFRRDGTLYSDLRYPKDGDKPETNVQGRIRGSGDYESRAPRPRSRERGNDIRDKLDSSVEHFDGPTCVQLINLPFQIRSEEIYDFCYGYRIIPGSVSIQYDQAGKSKGSATLVFESRPEALAAIRELSGRPIGPRKIQLILV